MSTWHRQYRVDTLQKLFAKVRVLDREWTKKWGEGSVIFKGQRADWQLQTLLERTCIALGVDLKQAEKKERATLREFKRRLQHYERRRPADLIEWLALMQHHGAATRFLDWTYSVHVAAYFALKYSVESLEFP